MFLAYTLSRTFYEEHMYWKAKYKFIPVFFQLVDVIIPLERGVIIIETLKDLNIAELVDSAIIYNLSYLILVNKGSDPWRRLFEFLCLSLN